MKKIYVASLNKAKLEAVKIVFNDYEVIPVEVHMDINQPLTDSETLEFAKKRANMLKGEYRLGLEAGVTILNDKCFLVNYGVLIDFNGNEYSAGGSYFELPDIIREELYQNKLVLKDAMTKHYKEEMKETGGAIEILTEGLVTRVDIFVNILKMLRGKLERNRKDA